MKILISDYSSNFTTEPLYLNTVFNNIGCVSTIWPKGVSTYDVFDIAKPELHITHHSYLTRDLVAYLKENPKIDLVINITGINQENLSRLDSFFKDENITPSFYYVNYYDCDLKSKHNIVSILHGADLFLGTSEKQYDIQNGIFINSKDQIKPVGDTYHFITSYENLTDSADIYFPIYRLSHMYNNYQRIIFRYFEKCLYQIFFDAAIYNGNVFFDLNDRTVLNENLNKILKQENMCLLDNEDSGKIRELIIKKHTCLHRAKSLLSQLSCKEYVDNLQNLIESSIK